MFGGRKRAWVSTGDLYTHYSGPDPKTYSYDRLRIVSIDPSYTKNLAIRVEDRHDPWTWKETILFEKIDLTGENSNVHQKLLSVLEERKEILLSATILLIERQLPTNYKSVRAQQVIQAWFLFSRFEGPIVELESRLKSKELKAPKGIDVKKWSVEVGINLSESRKDERSLEKLLAKRTGKKDDLSDTIIQVEAFFRYLFPNRPEPTLLVIK